MRTDKEAYLGKKSRRQRNRGRGQESHAAKKYDRTAPHLGTEQRGSGKNREGEACELQSGARTLYPRVYETKKANKRGKEKSSKDCGDRRLK